MRAKNSIQQLGIIGYGQMGAAMAPLLGAHRELVVYDVDQARLDIARSAGTRVASDVARCAASEVLILALPGPREVREVLRNLGRPGQLIIDTTSLDAATAQCAERLLSRRGACYVEAPVLGGPPQVGSWVFLCGGDEGSTQEALDALQRLGAGVHFGPVGKGSEAKLLNNMLTGLNAAAVAEMLTVARRLGTDVAKLQAAIQSSHSAGRNPVLEIRVPKILAGTLQDTFSMSNMFKDLSLAVAMAQDVAVGVPLTSLGSDLFQQAMEKGWGLRDIGFLSEALTT